MAQWRKKITTSLVHRLQSFESKWEKEISWWNCGVLLLPWGRCFGSWARCARRCTQTGHRHRVSDCDIPRGTTSISPWDESEAIRAFPVWSEKALWFLDGREAGLRYGPLDQVVDEVMALRSSWVSPARKSLWATRIHRGNAYALVGLAQCWTQPEAKGYSHGFIFQSEPA